MESGELCFYDATAIVEGRAQEALLAKNTAHKGGVRGLDFNNINKNLLASGAAEGEIFIWDMGSHGKPYSPGTRSNKLEDISAVSWNRGFASVMATASNNGTTVVWDLRSRTEVLALPHPAGRRMITGLAWNPDEAMQLVNISDDDYNPAVLLWDCRNARAPLKSLQGHNKGVLSVSWCPKDSDLLISAGKDNRTLCWDVKQGQLLGELQTSSNWAFDVQWSSRNPDLVAVGSFDRRVTVHSLIGLKNVSFDDSEQLASPVVNHFSNDENSFSAALQSFHNANSASQASAASSSGEFTLPRPPKWMRRCCSATWGFGGKLAVVTRNESTAKKSALAVRVPVTDVNIYKRLDLMDKIAQESDSQKLQSYCQTLENIQSQLAAEAAPDRSSLYKHERDYWMTLGALFGKQPRQQLLKMLGFEGAKIPTPGLEDILSKLSLSLAESSSNGSKTPAQANDVKKVPFHLYTRAPVSNAASATAGAATSPSIDTLLTKAVVVGDYETAVKLCLMQNRMTEALLFATVGDKEQINLVPMVRNYLLKQGRSVKSYFRVLDAAVSEDVSSVVDTAELVNSGSGDELLWRDLLAFICTYAKADEFSDLCLKLAQRLEAYKKSDGSAQDEELGFAASLCYLGANVYDPVVRYWLRSEDLLDNVSTKSDAVSTEHSWTRQSVHSLALQSLMEKVTLFDRLQLSESLSGAEAAPDVTIEELYGKYVDYADSVCSFGRVDISIQFLARIPDHFAEQLEPKSFAKYLELRHRCWHAAGSLSFGVFQREPAAPYTVQDIVQPEKPVFQPTADPDNQPLWNRYQPNNYNRYQVPPGVNQQQQIQQPQYSGPSAPNGFPNGSYTSQVPQVAAADGYAQPYAANPQLMEKYQQYGATSGTFPAPGTAFPPPRQAVGGSLPVPGPAPIVSVPQQPAYGYPPSSQPAITAPMNAAFQPPPLAPGPPSSMNVPPKHGFNDAPDLTPDVSRLMPKKVVAPPASVPAVNPYAAQARQNSISAQSPVYYANNASGVGGSGPNMGGMSGSTGQPMPPAGAGINVQPQPAAPVVPEVKRHPPGDRSHISPADMAIVSLTTKALDEWKRNCAPQQKRALDDAERKMNTLFDLLNNGEVPGPVLTLLHSICKALDARQYQVALQTVVVMLTSHSQAVSSWGNGLRRLCESLQALSFGRPM